MFPACCFRQRTYMAKDLRMGYSIKLNLLHVWIYIYIYIHRQICFILSELISVARHTSFPQLESKPGWLKRQPKLLPLSHEELYICAFTKEFGVLMVNVWKVIFSELINKRFFFISLKFGPESVSLQFGIVLRLVNWSGFSSVKYSLWILRY